LSAKERALKDMKEFRDLDVINSEHSTGSVYRAFPEFLEYAKGIYDELVARARVQEPARSTKASR